MDKKLISLTRRMMYAAIEAGVDQIESGVQSIIDGIRGSLPTKDQWRQYLTPTLS